MKYFVFGRFKASVQGFKTRVLTTFNARKNLDPLHSLIEKTNNTNDKGKI